MDSLVIGSSSGFFFLNLEVVPSWFALYKNRTLGEVFPVLATARAVAHSTNVQYTTSDDEDTLLHHHHDDGRVDYSVDAPPVAPLPIAP